MECTAEANEKNKQQADLTLTFPWGMPGLDYNEFTLSLLASDSPFYFLHSTKQPEVGLLLLNPFFIFKDYEFELTEKVTVQLKIADQKQVAVLCTVNTSRGIESATVNLLAPILINTEHLLAKQVVLHDQRYSLRTPLVLNPGAEKGER